MRSDEPGRLNPFTKMVTEAFDSLMRSMMFCLPGEVVAFDSESQVAQIRPSIQRIKSDGTGLTIPVIEDVPVQFSGDGEWYMWHQITPGTTGVILFSQRALDVWVESGGVVKPHDPRKFSEKDALFIPGIRPKPKAIPNFKNEGVGMSNYDGTEYFHLKPGEIQSEIPQFNFTGDFSLIGNMSVDGNITATGDVSDSTGSMQQMRDIYNQHGTGANNHPPEDMI